MNLDQASKIIGSQSRQCVRNMHLALGIFSWQNTAEETERREAARLVLRNWTKHTALCQARLDARHEKRMGRA